MTGIARFIRDQQLARNARVDYRRAARQIALVARDLQAAGADRWANEVSHLGFIAWVAARAEFIDPEPRP